MVEIVWTEPALADLEAIADYIALENPAAAAALVRRVYEHVSQLATHPASGPRLPEMGPRNRYRHLVEPPCRVLYRHDRQRVYVVHVMRTSRLLRPQDLDRLTPPE